MAHFLGLGGATRVPEHHGPPPQATGAPVPAAARANRSVFYAANGQPRTLSDIYNRFADKLAGSSADSDATRAANLQFAAQALALKGMGEDATVVPATTKAPPTPWPGPTAR
jgi:hypothetical protein